MSSWSKSKKPSEVIFHFNGDEYKIVLTLGNGRYKLIKNNTIELGDFYSNAAALSAAMRHSKGNCNND